MEMAHESWCQSCSSSTRRGSSTYHLEIFNGLLVEHRSIINDTFIYEKPQELNRWLSSIHLNLWHIDIIDKYQAFWISLSSNDLLTSFLLQRWLDGLLNLFRPGLSWEVYDDWCVVLGFHVQVYVLLDDYWLASSWNTSEENSLVAVHQLR